MRDILKINRWLAQSLAVLNAFVGGFIILLAFGIGASTQSPGLFIVSMIAGGLAAVLLCGLMAVFVEIRRELADIRELLASQAVAHHPHMM